jgi:cytoskeletal protein CcmA (bactofilin family)
VVGKLACAGDLQIEGSVEGEVRAQGVRIGSGAVVRGTVTGEVVQVAGTLEGNIEAESVIVARTARITGDISYRSLQIDEGADFSGTCKPRRKAALPQRVEDNSVPSGRYVAPGVS